MRAMRVTYLAKHLAYARIAVAQGRRERGELYGRMVFFLVILGVFSSLWRAIGEAGLPIAAEPRALVWYLAATEWILLSTPPIHIDIQEAIRMVPIIVLAIVASAVVIVASGIVFFGLAFWLGRVDTAARQLWELLDVLALSGAALRRRVAFCALHGAASRVRRVSAGKNRACAIDAGYLDARRCRAGVSRVRGPRVSRRAAALLVRKPVHDLRMIGRLLTAASVSCESRCKAARVLSG
jgi:hypothetical protein